MINLLEIKNASIGYTEPILKNINFTVNQGDFVFIVGSNGIGKSTLIKTILGINKCLSGAIYTNFNLSDVGYLSQSQDIVKNFPASVEEVVLSGCLNNPLKFFYTKKDRQLAEKCMKRLKIFNIKNENYGLLSGGQKQRTLIARALCAYKNILILDEPTNNLDSEIAKDFYDLLFKLNSEGLTIIVISHDLDLISTSDAKVLNLDRLKRR